MSRSCWFLALFSVVIGEGRGWRLETVDLQRAVADGRTWGPDVLVRTQTFPDRDELEGYRPLPDGSGLFVTSSRKNNLVVGKMKAAPASTK
jgi:hypothetical protein